MISFAHLFLLHSPNISHIDAAISSQRLVYVKYHGGTNPGKVRGVQVTKWISRPHTFSIIQEGHNAEQKIYVITRVEEIRSSPFV